MRSCEPEFLLLAFQPSNAYLKKPECVDDGLVLTNDFIKKSKIQAIL